MSLKINFLTFSLIIFEFIGEKELKLPLFLFTLKFKIVLVFKCCYITDEACSSLWKCSVVQGNGLGLESGIICVALAVICIVLMVFLLSKVIFPDEQISGSMYV